MATQEWLEAARNYSLMPEGARAEYWRQLTPDQQDALREALDASQVVTRTTPVVTSEADTKRGCGGPVGAGCLGMILGCILTIGVEVAIISAGIDAVGEMLRGLLDPGPSRVRSEPAPAREPEPERSADCRDPQYRREHTFLCGSEQSCIEDCRERFSE